MKKIRDNVQINIPFAMLYDSYLEHFVKEGFQPEIGFDARALDAFTRNEYKGVAERCRSNGLQVTFHAPFVDLSPGSPDPEIRRITRRRFEQVVRLLPLFRPRTMVCHVGFEIRRYGYLRDVWLEKSIEMWTWLGERAGWDGTKLMLENVCEKNPEELQPLFESLDRKKVGFCFDVGHQAAFSSASLETWIGSLGSFIGQVHLHDNSGTGDDHRGLGRGTIDFSSLFRFLKDALPEPPVITLEPHQKEDVWPSLNYLERLWPW